MSGTWGGLHDSSVKWVVSRLGVTLSWSWNRFLGYAHLSSLEDQLEDPGHLILSMLRSHNAHFFKKEKEERKEKKKGKKERKRGREGRGKEGRRQKEGSGEEEKERKKEGGRSHWESFLESACHKDPL